METKYPVGTVAITGRITRKQDVTTFPNALYDTPVSNGAKLLYAVLLDYSQSEAPTQEELAQRFGRTARTIRMWLRELQDAELLTVAVRGPTKTNCYTLRAI